VAGDIKKSKGKKTKKKGIKGKRTMGKHGVFDKGIGTGGRSWIKGRQNQVKPNGGRGGLEGEKMTRSQVLR